MSEETLWRRIKQNVAYMAETKDYILKATVITGVALAFGGAAQLLFHVPGEIAVSFGIVIAVIALITR